MSGDGKTLAVGASEEGSNTNVINGDESNNLAPLAGAVYVFKEIGSAWTQQAYIKAVNANPADEFGIAVSLSADVNALAVGAHLESSRATGVNGISFNNAVGSSGAAYIFVRDESTWTQQAYVKSSNTDRNDFFGWALALSSDAHTLAVGAYSEDSAASGTSGTEAMQNNNNATDAGAVYVFEVPNN